MLQVRVAFGSPTRGMLILELHPDHTASFVDLVLGDDGNELLIIRVRGCEIVRRAVSNLHVLAGNPLRDTSGKPFGAVVGPRSHNGVHPRCLDFRQPGVEVEVIGRLEHARRRLLSIPKHVCRNGIEAGTLHFR